jgi:hypothetical protein
MEIAFAIAYWYVWMNVIFILIWWALLSQWLYFANGTYLPIGFGVALFTLSKYIDGFYFSPPVQERLICGLLVLFAAWPIFALCTRRDCSAHKQKGIIGTVRIHRDSIGPPFSVVLRLWHLSMMIALTVYGLAAVKQWGSLSAVGEIRP